MIWQRVKCSPPWIARLAEALAVCSLIHSRGAQAFNISPYSQARGCWRGCRAASTALRPAVDVEASSPPSVRDYGRLQALSSTLYGTSAWSTGSYERGAVRRRERVPILPRSHSQPHSRPQQQWQGQRHPRCAASSSAEGDNVTTDRVTDDAAAAARGSAATGTATAAAVGQDLKAIANATVEEENYQEDEPPLHLIALDDEGEKEQDEQEEEDEETFPELPEELKEMRGAFLDGPGQYLDVDKILAETEFIGHADVPEGFRTGYVTIVGSPNVGKSTLMNNMIGDRLSIVTPKAGTTRHRITGIMTGTDFQMIYQDTPGVLTPAYMLHEGMMNFVQEAMGDADAVLFVTDLFEVDFAGQEIFERMLASGKPIVVAVNKVDLLPSEGDGSDGEARLGRLSATKLEEVGSLEDILLRWRERLPGATVLPISALEGINTAQLAEELKQHIPVGPPLFANDVMSDKPLRFFAAEIIREQIFVSFSQEIPYSCEVRLERFKERQAETVIDATIIVSQESQKGMVIGKGGAKIKEVGIKARNALEEYLGVRVNLRLNVKVDKNWRKKKASLKEYGYIS